MKLTQSQKKFLKKNLRQLSLSEIAKQIAVPEEKVLEYLKSIWSEQKYQKYVSAQKQIKTFPQNPPTTTKLSLWLKQNYGALAFLCTLVLVVYFNSLGNEFLSDDIPTIVQNQNINNYGYYLKNQPLLILRHFYLITVYKIFGLKPIFFRLGNIFFHLGSVLTIYSIFTLLYNPFLALATASLFAVHPVLIEAVAWISGGIHAQYTFFTLLSFLFYLLTKRGQWSTKFYLLSVFTFGLALSSCEKSAILPLILLSFEVCFGELSKTYKKLIPFFSLGGIWSFWVLFGGVLAHKTTALRAEYYQQGGFYNPLTQIPTAISSYLQLIFWPDKLTLYHSEMFFTTGEYILRLLLTLLLFSIIIFTFLKKNLRHYSFWLSLFVIALLPMLTPLKVGWIVAERYVYFGSLGIFAVMGLLCQRLKEKWKNDFLIYGILGTILIILTVRTIIRNADWKNQDSLWLAAAKTSPSSPQNHNNLGDLYSRHGNFEKAVEEFKEAIRLLPNYGDAYHNLANTYLQMNKIDLAIQNYQNALHFNPNIWQSHQNLGVIYVNQEKYDLAKQNFTEALRLNPQSASLYASLGVVYLKTGQNQTAKEEFLKALQIDPNNQNVRNLLQQASP